MFLNNGSGYLWFIGDEDPSGMVDMDDDKQSCISLDFIIICIIHSGKSRVNQHNKNIKDSVSVNLYQGFFGFHRIRSDESGKGRHESYIRERRITYGRTHIYPF